MLTGARQSERVRVYTEKWEAHGLTLSQMSVLTGGVAVDMVKCS